MTFPPNPVFRFQGETHIVKVDNVAHTGRVVAVVSVQSTSDLPKATQHDVVKLFTTLIGICLPANSWYRSYANG